MSTVLMAQQTALLDMLHRCAADSMANDKDLVWVDGPFSSANPALALRGLRAYRANAQEFSANALQASHPVLYQMLGEDNFRHFAQDFWQAMPPQCGDLAQWGGLLPAFLPQVPQLHALLLEHPYLADVASAEWALHLAATATDAALDAESFHLLASKDPERLRLVLGPGCTVLRSAYPVAALLQLHDPRASDVHAQAHEQIARRTPQIALIWRQGYRPMIAVADPAPAALIEASLRGASLSRALHAAISQTSDFDVSAWLPAQVQAGVLLGVARM